MRQPQTTVTLPRPVAVPAASDTPDARLSALEAQRVHDHMVINDFSNALTALQGQVEQQSSGLQALTQSSLSFRQEVFAARSGLATGIAGAN